MQDGCDPIARMALQLARLPGIGQKSAQRLAYHIAAMPQEQVKVGGTEVRGKLLLGQRPHQCQTQGGDEKKDNQLDPKILTKQRDQQSRQRTGGEPDGHQVDGGRLCQRQHHQDDEPHHRQGKSQQMHREQLLSYRLITNHIIAKWKSLSGSG